MSDAAILQEASWKANRTAWGTAILRWLIGVVFLYVAFSDFPSHIWTIGLGLVVFNLTVGGVGDALQVVAINSNRLDDLGERKTRHTIVLAAERAGQADMNTPDFWAVVDGRVKAELGDPQKVGTWATIGLVAGRITWQLVADLFGIALVAAMVGAN